MNELAELVGIYPADIKAVVAQQPERVVDETNLEIDADQLETLVSVVTAADSSLRDLEEKSTTFERDIKQLSAEMSALQTQSASLHNRLVSRNEALAQLQPLLDKFVIPTGIVNEIFSGEIGPQFRAALSYALDSMQEQDTTSKSGAGAARLCQVLVARAVERIKAFYVQKLRLLRRPGANAQIVQTDLVNNGTLMRFLQKQTPRLAAGLERAYKNTMRWYYTMLFGKYGRWLDRQPMPSVDSVKLLGSVVSSSSSSASMFTMGMSAAKQLDTFNVGSRPAALRLGPDSTPALALTAVPPTTNPYYPIEVLVRSMLLTLGDAFATEANVAEAENLESLTEVFEPTLLFYEDLLSKWVANSAGDTFGLLLVVRLCQQTPLNRWITDWLRRCEDKCWPRIISACEAQAASVEAAALKPSTSSSTRALSNVGPHPMTQLVSAFVSGILQLSPDKPEQQLSRVVHAIVEAYELFISKLSAGDEQVLYNNYFVMSALLSDIEGPLASEFARHFELLVDAYASRK